MKSSPRRRPEEPRKWSKKLASAFQWLRYMSYWIRSFFPGTADAYVQGIFGIVAAVVGVLLTVWLLTGTPNNNPQPQPVKTVEGRSDDDHSQSAGDAEQIASAKVVKLEITVATTATDIDESIQVIFRLIHNEGPVKILEMSGDDFVDGTDRTVFVEFHDGLDFEKNCTLQIALWGGGRSWSFHLNVLAIVEKEVRKSDGSVGIIVDSIDLFSDSGPREVNFKKIGDYATRDINLW